MEIHPLHILIQAGIFLTVLLLLDRLVFRPVLKIFQEREKRMSGDREEARLLGKKAQERVHEYEGKIDRAKTEAKEIKTQILRRAMDEEREILNQARENASQIIAKRREQLVQEGKELFPEMMNEARGLAQEMAEMVLERKVS